MTEDQAKTIADFLLGEIEQEFATTKTVLAAVPADRTSYKPSEKCRNALDLASHIAAAETFFLRGVIDGKFEWQQPDFKTPAEAKSYYEKTVPDLIAQARALPASKLATNIKFGPFEQPAVTYLSMELRHGVHHRGQLAAYLRPMGAKVPAIYGPSGDTDEETAAH